MVQEVERREPELNLLVLLEQEVLVNRKVAVEESRPLMHGQITLPSAPPVGGAKQDGLKYWPDFSSRGSQVSMGKVDRGAFVPR